MLKWLSLHVKGSQTWMENFHAKPCCNEVGERGRNWFLLFFSSPTLSFLNFLSWALASDERARCHNTSIPLNFKPWSEGLLELSEWAWKGQRYTLHDCSKPSAGTASIAGVVVGLCYIGLLFLVSTVACLIETDVAKVCDKIFICD